MNCDTTTTATAGTTLVQKAREAKARAAALVEEQILKLAAFKEANAHRAWQVVGVLVRGARPENQPRRTAARAREHL